MRKEYDFSDAKPNPYAKRMKQQVTIRLDRQTVAYFNPPYSRPVRREPVKYASDRVNRSDDRPSRSLSYGDRGRSEKRPRWRAIDRRSRKGREYGGFKALATENGIPYQTLINLYLRDCAANRKKLAIRWKPAT